MLVLSEAKLVYLAVPKTGSTAVEAALRQHADVIFAHKRKHITARRYRSDIAPFLKRSIGLRDLETCAVMRAPINQLRSWYRYRGRPEVPEDVSTRHLSFDDFVRAVISPDPPPFAQVGSQHRFLTNRRGHLIVHHLFAFEAQHMLLGFLSARLGKPLKFARKNVSRDRKAELSPDVETELRVARAKEFELYERLVMSTGYLGDAVALT